MNANEYIDSARIAHEMLRARSAGTRPDEQSAAAYRTFKDAMDQLWAAAEQSPDARQIRNTLGRLTTDAEFFAGLTDSEGYRDAAEAWQQYAYLRQAVSCRQSHE